MYIFITHTHYKYESIVYIYTVMKTNISIYLSIYFTLYHCEWYNEVDICWLYRKKEMTSVHNFIQRN